MCFTKSNKKGLCTIPYLNIKVFLGVPLQIASVQAWRGILVIFYILLGKNSVKESAGCYLVQLFE